MLKTVVRNAASNWMGVFVQAVITFFLTPFVLDELGGTRYGIWALIVSLSGYYGLLDLGFRAGMTQYMTRYLASRDFARLNQTASTAFVALTCCSLIVGLCTFALCWLSPRIFEIPTANIEEAQWCIIVVGLSVAVQFGYYPFSTVFAATQRYDLANGIAIGARIFAAVGTLICLRSGFGLVGLAAVNALADQCSYGIRWRLAYRILPELVVSYRLASREMFRPIVSFGFWSALTASARMLKSRAAMLLIGVLLPVAAIAPYAVALGLAERVDSLIAPLANVLFPAITTLDAQGDLATLRRLFLHASRVILLLAISLSVIASFLAADFFQLWVGAALRGTGDWPPPASLFYPLAAAAVCTACHRVGFQVFLGVRRVRQLSHVVVVQAIVELMLIVVFIRWLGLSGAPWAMFCSSALFEMIILPMMLFRFLQIPLGQYVLEVWLRPAAILLLLLPTVWLALQWLPSPTNWWTFLLVAAFTGSLVLAVILLAGFSRAERRRFILDPAVATFRKMYAAGFGAPGCIVRRWRPPANVAESAEQLQEVGPGSVVDISL